MAREATIKVKLLLIRSTVKYVPCSTLGRLEKKRLEEQRDNEEEISCCQCNAANAAKTLPPASCMLYILHTSCAEDKATTV